jgi:hypothetical protein
MLRNRFNSELILLVAILAGLTWGASESGIRLEDVARQWGISEKNVFGGLNQKDLILETTGNGAAIVDVDGDGREDLVLLNGLPKLNADLTSAAGGERGF